MCLMTPSPAMPSAYSPSAMPRRSMSIVPDAEKDRDEAAAAVVATSERVSGLADVPSMIKVSARSADRKSAKREGRETTKRYGVAQAARCADARGAVHV